MRPVVLIALPLPRRRAVGGGAEEGLRGEAGGAGEGVDAARLGGGERGQAGGAVAVDPLQVHGALAGGSTKARTKASSRVVRLGVGP